MKLTNQSKMILWMRCSISGLLRMDEMVPVRIAKWFFQKAKHSDTITPTMFKINCRHAIRINNQLEAFIEPSEKDDNIS